MEKCNEEIYKNGIHIGIMAGGSAEIIDYIVNKIATHSGQQIDWHYVGGRANILCVGDSEKAKYSFNMLKLQYGE